MVVVIQDTKGCCKRLDWNSTVSMCDVSPDDHPGGLNLYLDAYGNGQDSLINYDEAKMPPYTLPDPLELTNGNRITTKGEWI